MCPYHLMSLLAVTVVAASVAVAGSPVTTTTTATSNSTDGIEVFEIVQDTIGLMSDSGNGTDNGTVLVEIEEDTVVVLNTITVNGTTEVINGTAYGKQDISILNPDYGGSDSSESSSSASSSSEEQIMMMVTSPNNETKVFPLCNEIGCGPGQQCDPSTNTCRTSITDV